MGILTISASLPILTAICEYNGFATAGPVVEVSKGTLVAVFSRTFKGVFAISGFGCSFCQVVSIVETMNFLPISEALNTDAFFPMV